MSQSHTNQLPNRARSLFYTRVMMWEARRVFFNRESVVEIFVNSLLLGGEGSTTPVRVGGQSTAAAPDATAATNEGVTLVTVVRESASSRSFNPGDSFPGTHLLRGSLVRYLLQRYLARLLCLLLRSRADQHAGYVCVLQGLVCCWFT